MVALLWPSSPDSEATHLGGALSIADQRTKTKLLEFGQSTVVKFTEEHKGMQATLRIQFSHGIVYVVQHVINSCFYQSHDIYTVQ